MVHRWIYLTVLILFHIWQVVLGQDRILEITGSLGNPTIPVWTRDHVEIIARDTLVSKWSFNNITIAELDPFLSLYNYPNTSLLINIAASPGTRDSSLTLANVNRIYNGTYEADEDPGVYLLSMIVHEVNLSSAIFNLTDDSSSCRAYLFINDFVDPSDFEVLRMVNSLDLRFTPADPSNITSFEIVHSRLNVTNNPTETQINVQYTFASNNFSTVRSRNISLNLSLIRQPSVTSVGAPDNCTILIQHNTDAPCVHNITYCLTVNDTEFVCNVSSNLDNLILEYPWNSTFANLSIIYDVIYAKYRFDIDSIQCTAEVATSVEPTTMNSSPPEITTAQSGTSDDMTTSEDVTNHSNSIYSSMSPCFSSTDSETATISLTTASLELPSITIFPSMNITGPSANPGSLAGWIIALIVVGSVLAAVLLGGGVSLFLWKVKSRKTFDPDIPLEVRPSSNEHVVRKLIPPIEPTNQSQVQYDRQPPFPIRTLSTSPARMERQQRRYERRQPHSPRNDQTIRPSIPQPTTKSYAPSSRQEVPRQRREAHPIDYEQFPQPFASRPISTSPDPVYQQQLPRDRRRPLPPIPNE